MGENSAIQWTDHTFNPWIGCTRVSPGCMHCYAELRDRFVTLSRARGVELWGVDGFRHVTSAEYWKKPFTWNRKAAAAGVRARVFCASLADWAEDIRILDAPRAKLFPLIEATPCLDWLLLTKRIDRVMALVPPHWHAGFPPNVWLGTSVEDQKRAVQRIPELLSIPAAVHFLSCEPLLERVDLTPWLWGRSQPCPGCSMDADCACGFSTRRANGEESIDWVIVGGESGAGARPFNIEWCDALIQQCQAAEVPVFVKQLGNVPTILRPDPCGPPSEIEYRLQLRDEHGGDLTEWPRHLRVRQYPTPSFRTELIPTTG